MAELIYKNASDSCDIDRQTSFCRMTEWFARNFVVQMNDLQNGRTINYVIPFVLYKTKSHLFYIAK